MKLGPYLYQLNTFNIANNEGANEWASGGCNQKSHQKMPWNYENLDFNII